MAESVRLSPQTDTRARDASLIAALRTFPRQALHAMRLGFVHPVTGDDMSFETEPPDDLQRLISVLRGTET